MMKQRYFLLVVTMLFMLLGGTGLVNAQRLSVHVVLQKADGKKTNLEGAQVYSFQFEREAKIVQKKLQDYADIDKRDGYVDEGKTDKAGTIELIGNEKGYLVIDATQSMDLDIIVVNVSKNVKKGKNANDLPVVECVLKSKAGDEKVTNLQEVSKTGHRNLSKDKMGTGDLCGNRLTFNRTPIYVRRQHARNDARFVASPVLTLPLENNDTLKFFRPVVLNGKDYYKTQERRMDWDIYKNDKLQQFEDKAGHFMTTRTEDSVFFSGEIYPYDRTKKYRIAAHRWYEDYNTVYYEDVQDLYDGNPREPMRFLNWDDARINVEIDTARYSRRAISTVAQDKKSYHLEFEVGKAALKMEDSLTVAQLDLLKKDLSRYYNDPNSKIEGVTIRAYSSPEGSSATNRTLSHNRSQYMRSTLDQMFPNRSRMPAPQAKFNENDNIVTWNEVADTLDNIGTEYSKMCAEELRKICEEKKGFDAQWATIRNQEWYKFVNENALPRVRRVEIEYSYVAVRILSGDEIYENFLHNPAYQDGSAEKPYEFYQLMRRLSDEKKYDALYTIAKAAYKSSAMKETVTRTVIDSVFHRDIKADSVQLVMKESADYDRSDPLAAYYLASCMLKKHELNTKILNDYLDYSNDGLSSDKPKRNFDGQSRGYWNEPAIAVTQILMYCELNDFMQAERIALRHLPDEPQYQKLKLFVQCLNCGYNDDKRPEIRDTVAASSPMNAAVIYVAQDKRDWYMKADTLLSDSSKINQNDARVQYLKAIVRFKLECGNQDLDVNHYNSKNIYDPEAAEYGEKALDWAAPMLEAFRLDKTNVDYIKHDGYFNDAYRALVLFFWERTQAGATMEEAAREYDALVTKYYSADKVAAQ